MDRQMVFDYINKKYRTLPEYPWRRYDSNAVFRHADNRKWFALVMDVQGDKLGLSVSDYVNVINTGSRSCWTALCRMRKYLI